MKKLTKAQVDKITDLLSKGICPHCKGKLIKKGWGNRCLHCRLNFFLSDDMGPTRWVERKMG